MQIIRSLKNTYTQIEILFFVCYYLLFRILTTVEYNFYETAYSPLNVQQEIIYGIKAMIPAWICYKILIQHYLFKKKYLRFIFFYIVYLILLKFYDICAFWVIANLNFISVSIRDQAMRYYQTNISTNLYHFASVYMLRELILLSAVAYFIRSSKLDKQISMIQKEKLQSELKYLKVQLQPHFFFNTLNNIYALTLVKSEKAAPLVAKHSEMMRYILYEASSQTVSLEKELLFLKNYVEVERIRYPEETAIVFETQGISTSAKIEPLLLLPLIENTFKHGLREKTNNGYIYIIVSLVERELSVEITNSKAEELSDHEKGIGLANMEDRLKILYPSNYKIEINDGATEYEVRLTLTIKHND